MKIIKYNHFTATITRVVSDRFTKTIHVNINIKEFNSRVIIFNFFWDSNYTPFIELDNDLDIFPLDQIQVAVGDLIRDLKSGTLELDSSIF